MKVINKEFSKILDPIFEKRSNILYQLSKCWSQIVGRETASKTQPSKISFKNKCVTLHITCMIPGVGTELFYQESMILEKIYFFLGKNIINKLKINQNIQNESFEKTINKYIVPESFNKEIQYIRDEILAHSLQSFLKIFAPRD